MKVLSPPFMRLVEHLRSLLFVDVREWVLAGLHQPCVVDRDWPIEEEGDP